MPSEALLVFLKRREALSPIGAVEVLGAFDLAAGPHVWAYLWLHADNNPYPVHCCFFTPLEVRGLWHFLLWHIMKCTKIEGLVKYWSIFVRPMVPYCQQAVLKWIALIL